MTDATFWFLLFTISCGYHGWQWATIKRLKKSNNAHAQFAVNAQLQAIEWAKYRQKFNNVKDIN